jgi:hypothetical protein
MGQELVASRREFSTLEAFHGGSGLGSFFDKGNQL